MNMHSQGSAGLLSSSAVVALMNESREMNLSMPAHPGLVLVTEATLQAAPFFPQRVVLQNPRDCLHEVWEISTFSYIASKAPQFKTKHFSSSKSVYSIITSTS